MKIHLVMPMGGAGSRFYKNGYMQPKPLIRINDKPFFYWSTMSLMKYIDEIDVTYVVLKQHVDDFGIDDEIRRYFPEAKIKVIPNVLPGPVYTSLIGVENISDDEPLIFNDCDHMFKCSKLNEILNKGVLKEDGGILTFTSDEPQFSYVKFDKQGHIEGTIEKKVVSDSAICGAYLFKNAKLFRNISESYTKSCPYNECYMSGLYNTMADLGLELREYKLDFHVEFGTPDEYEKAQKSLLFSEIE